ncbi:MAG: LD-carboxypeptidase [Flaviflexus sp.]|nr:LD-carboxypeptidase [Flaviflexus sp.]
MNDTPIAPPALAPNQKIAVLSPSMAAPAYAPAIHEQAMTRLAEITGREIVEYPTTRQLGASAADRARDVCAAFADPEIGAVMSTVGGNDQITVLPHLDEAAILDNPKPFLGYSDNTHLHNWLWSRDIASFYGGSTQVHLGAGPKVDEEQRTSLLSALNGGSLELVNPPLSEDYGVDWSDPKALTETGIRRSTPDYQWFGPTTEVTAHTWGGCVEVLVDILIARAFTGDEKLDGAILLLELSEDVMSPMTYGRFLRALGERGLLGRLAGLMLARPPATSFDYNPPEDVQESHRRNLVELTAGAMEKYNPKAVVVYGVPFGHTRPQWIVPYGGRITLDPRTRTVRAHYR